MARPDPLARCSSAWDHQAIPAWGTATQAAVVVALEQPGPWGTRALVESHLDPDVGRSLDKQVTNLDGRLMLIRRPGRHTVPVEPYEREVLVARTGTNGWLVRARLSSPHALLRLTPELLREPTAVAAALGGQVTDEPALLVCTNGRRDACCALRGRPVALAGSALDPGVVWEVTHTGGHRFAPTGILLPWGRMLARLDEDLVGHLIEHGRRARLPLTALGPVHDRGGMHLAPSEQAVEAFLRQQLDWVDLSEPVPTSDGQVRVDVVHGPALAVSCGREPEPTSWFAPSWRAPTVPLPASPPDPFTLAATPAAPLQSAPEAP